MCRKAKILLYLSSSVLNFKKIFGPFADISYFYT